MQYRLYLQIGAVAVLAASAAAASAVIGLRRRPDPAEREKRRRLDVNIAGRLADGSIIDVTESTVYYSYSVHGVGYTAAQDVEPVRELIACAPDKLIGPVSVKYFRLTRRTRSSSARTGRACGLALPPAAGNNEKNRSA